MTIFNPNFMTLAINFSLKKCLDLQIFQNVQIQRREKFAKFDALRVLKMGFNMVTHPNKNHPNLTQNHSCCAASAGKQHAP
jgi:hypothetical protein